MHVIRVTHTHPVGKRSTITQKNDSFSKPPRRPAHTFQEILKEKTPLPKTGRWKTTDEQQGTGGESWESRGRRSTCSTGKSGVGRVHAVNNYFPLETPHLPTAPSLCITFHHLSPSHIHNLQTLPCPPNSPHLIFFSRQKPKSQHSTTTAAKTKAPV